MQTVRIARVKKNFVEFSFQSVEQVPFDYSFEIKYADHSQLLLQQNQEQSVMVLQIQSEEHWEMFLRNQLFLSLLALASGINIDNIVQYTKIDVEEIFKGLDLKLKWDKRFQYSTCELSKIIVFKQDLIVLKQLLQKEKLDICSMAEIKRQNAFNYVRCLGVKMVTESNFRTDIPGTIRRLKQIFKQTSAEDRFKIKGHKLKFQKIEEEVRQAYVNSFNNSLDSEPEKEPKESILELLQEKFSDIDHKIQKRELNLLKLGTEIDHFINLITQGSQNKQKVQVLVGFLLQKVLKFFRLKPQQICWSGLPTVREVISERSSQSRDYDDYFQQKEQLLQTVTDLTAKVQKYEKQINQSKVSSKPSTPNILNPRLSMTKSNKFTKQIKPKEDVKSKQPKQIKQKELKSGMVKMKTGVSSRSSLSSTTSLKPNKSLANIVIPTQKNKRLTVAGLQNPLPLVEMKLNKTMNGASSGISTPKTQSKPKFDSLKKPLEPKLGIRSTKVSSRIAK